MAAAATGQQSSGISLGFAFNQKDLTKFWAWVDRFQQNTGAYEQKKLMMLELRPFLQLRMRRRFAGEGDDASNKWAPLTSFTELLRTQHGFGAAHPINRRTGGLYRYVMNTYDLSSGLGSVRITIPSVQGDATVKRKFSRAQKGGTTRLPGGGMSRPFPARPVVAFDQTDASGLGDKFEAWVNRMLLASN